MKLFRVEISTEVVVVARDADHAREVAEDMATEILGTETMFDFMVTPSRGIWRTNQLPLGWDDACIPYRDRDMSDDPRETIAAWLENPDPPTELEREAAGQLNALTPTASVPNEETR